MTDLDIRLERELMKPENFPKRFKFARLRADETHGSLGKQTGMSDAASWQWEAGNNMPSTPSLTKAAKVLGVNVAWLKSGVGEMLASRGDPAPAPKMAEKLNGTTGPDGMDLTGRLRFAREKTGMTYVEIAKKVGIGTSSLGFHFLEIDSPNYRKPSVEILHKYAQVLGVKELWLETGIGKVSWDREDKVEKSEDRALPQRLTDCAIRAGLESKQIAKKLGIGAGAFSKHSTLTGVNVRPNRKVLIEYSKLFDVPFKWLDTGAGEAPFEMRPFDIQAFRRNIREYCDSEKITNAQLCERIGCHYGTFAAWITTAEHARPPKPVTVGRIALALGVNFDWLFSGVGQMKPETFTEIPDVTVPSLADEGQTEDLPKPVVQTSTVTEFTETQDAEIVTTPELPEPLPTMSELAPKQELAMPTNSLQATSLKLTDLIAERDEYRALADSTQVEIDRWTAVLMNQVSG